MIKQNFNSGWFYREVQHAHIIAEAEQHPVVLPHDPIISKPRDPNSRAKGHSGYRNGSEFIYDKDFYIPDDKAKVYVLEFEGLSDHALVYVNSEYVGKCHNCYTNYKFDISQHLKYGDENHVRVVTCSAAMPSSRWYIGGGIYRDVNLYSGDLLHIDTDGIKFTTEELDKDLSVVRIDTTVVNSGHLPQTAWIITEIFSPDGTLVAHDSAPVTPYGNDKVTLRQRLCIANPLAWSADSPSLYRIHSTLKVDDHILEEIAQEIGIRKLALDPIRGLRVNGQSVKLRGACIHHNNGFLGIATYESFEERRVMLLKSAGFNAIRSSHNPMSKAMLRACDRLGMYVMDEGFDQWNKPKVAYDYSLNFAEGWEYDVEAMVEKDYNHPCVVMYSIGNEIKELFDRDSTHLSRIMADKVRSLDPTRYVTNCVNGWLCVYEEVESLAFEQMKAEGKKPVDINDAMNSMTRNDMRNLLSRSPRMGDYLNEPAAALDILGLNYMTDRYAIDHELHPNRIIVGSETFPRDIAYNWKTIMCYPNVLGDFTWTGLEYLGEVGIVRPMYGKNDPDFYGPYPHSFSGSGDIDFTGTRRPISFYREIVFGLRSDPYIAIQQPAHYGEKYFVSAWGWSDSISSWTWPGFEGKPVAAEVYADADEVELLLNGTSLGIQPCGASNDYIAKFNLSYVPGTLIAVARSNGKEIGRFKLETAAAPSVISVEPSCTTLKTGANDLCFMTLRILGQNGILNPADDRDITVHVSGAGELAGFGNADPLASGNYSLNHMRTFNGIALAILKAGAESGIIKVDIESPGMEPQSIEITVE